jgi:dimethylaniline monooxygenase (N-oxide forming)
MRVAVVGAGPGGLVTLKYLATAHQFFPDLKPIEVRLFEAEAEVGGTFRYRTYENAEVRDSHCPLPGQERS